MRSLFICFVVFYKGDSIINTTIDIYHEHIEEAAFLYDQRNNLLSEPDGDLEYQSQIEERLEAHIDALELGAENSIPILKKYLNSDDDGEIFTAIYSLLRMGKAEQNQLMEIFETPPLPSTSVLSHAFRFINSKNINNKLLQWFSSDFLEKRLVAIEVFGYKGNLEVLPQVEKLLLDTNIKVKTEAMNAINRLDPKLGRKVAYTYLMEGNSLSNQNVSSDPNQETEIENYTEACFTNLFILQENTVFLIAKQYCEGKYPYTPSAAIIIGLRGNEEDKILLTQLIKNKNIHRSIFQAIGYAGNIELLEKLIPLNDKPEYKFFIQETAHLITGSEPPDFSEEDDTDNQFSLEETLSSFQKDHPNAKERFRLGKLINKENENKILYNIAAIYRKWLYINNIHNGSNLKIEHDDLAKYQYSAIKT